MENFYNGTNQFSMIENRARVYRERDHMSDIAAYAKAYDELADIFQVPKLSEPEKK